MELNQFQSSCLSTRTSTCENIDYPIHEIIEESAELYDKFYNSLPADVRNSDIQLRTIHAAIMHAGALAKARAKSVRRGEIASAILQAGDHTERKEMSLEAFDVMWGVASLCDTLDIPLEKVAVSGLQKLADRFKRNQIVGDGDHR